MRSSGIERSRAALAFIALVALVFLGVVAAPKDARAAADPHIDYRTIHTKHFSITYESQSREVGEHVASIAETIFDEMTQDVGWVPYGRTEILLQDPTDAANGSASALPYNAVRLLITAPDDMSPLGDVDDWYLELVTHEYTHILHTDHIRGIPAIINAVLGKTFAPNQVQPRWLLEGLAVYHESKNTSGGRLRSSMWNMWMRTDVLENNVATLDQFSNTVRRFPQGNIWYLYGSYFLDWIARTYGEESLRQMAHDYGGQIVPWGFNRSIRRATGKPGRTFEELYPAWVDSMKREYGAVAAAVRAKGIREGVRVTHHGEQALHARWLPDTAWPHNGPTLAYFRDDGHDRTGIYTLPLVLPAQGGGPIRALEDRVQLKIRTTGDSVASFTRSGETFFNSLEILNNLYAFGDLSSLPAGAASPNGDERDRNRMTEGFRAYEADVSPDGRRIVFTTNHRGTRYLQIADLTGEPRRLTNLHTLVPSNHFEQVFTPRFSPDGRYVAYSVWTYGGFRDIRVVDLQDGSFVEIAHDRAVDGAPSFSADGRWIFFHSDRTGIMNVYAWERATGRLFQVTNVLTGAYQPEPSPDGKWLAYTSFSRIGYDLSVMPLDESNWLPAEPYVDTRPSPPPLYRHERTSPEPYQPLHTLWPRKYSVTVQPGAFGNEAATLSIDGSDIVGNHAVAATLISDFEHPELQGALSYAYARLPFDVGASAFRTIAPRSGFAFGSSYAPVVKQETIGAATSVSYAIPRAFDTQTFAASYAFARIGADLNYPIDKLDPYETPSFPTRGTIGTLHLGYGYSDAESFLWSVGPERGMTLGVTFDWADPLLAGDFSGYVVAFDLTRYFLMPWAQHHSLALHLGGGNAGGAYPGRGAFFLGGFTDVSVVDTLRNQIIQGGFVLRGYPVVAIYGSNYGLLNSEYRFPILNVDRGPSTLPVFLNRITGTVFADYGTAFDDATQARFKLGTGGEITFQTTMGYSASFLFRLGYAHGWQSLGQDKVYFVAAVPY
jgi:hypothetical protein